MSARRLLGYVVKLPDGTRSPRTPEPDRLRRAAILCNTECPMGSHVVPVFAASKPAPVVAAEGRWAVLNRSAAGDVWFGDFDTIDDPTRQIGTSKEALALADQSSFAPSIVRILPDGAHEAAIEAARREERERVLDREKAAYERGFADGRIADGEACL